ncbi:unnamed protein product [Caenorhabditis sp. 36 PRJEB53466]|nr:unnamed protein product [Caenorhabditis sp. 36 PRJEB53466]
MDQDRDQEPYVRERDPRVINGVQPIIIALASLMFHLFPPGDFLFLDDDENIVTAILYCEISHGYLCVIFQEHGRYTHFRHVPAQEALQNG